jgi:hypothetical protein
MNQLSLHSSKHQSCQRKMSSSSIRNNINIDKLITDIKISPGKDAAYHIAAIN